MTALTKTYPAHAVKPLTRLHQLRLGYERLIQQLDFSYFAFISFCIAFSACLGGGLVKFSLEYNTVLWQFVLGMCLSLVNIIACVAQFPTRWIFGIFVSSTLANTVLILISVFL